MSDLSKNTIDPGTKKVLIVDDEDSIRELLDFVIKREGFDVETAADGEEALQKVSSYEPDLIVLDLMLPRYGGFEILRQLQMGAMAAVPIVVVTGRYTDQSTAEMIRQESNVMEFLEKPVKPGVLTGAIHKILKTRPPAKKTA